MNEVFDPMQPAQHIGTRDTYGLYRQGVTYYLVEHIRKPGDWSDYRATVVPDEWIRHWLSPIEKVESVLHSMGRL